jgi:hypothetical protein
MARQTYRHVATFIRFGKNADGRVSGGHFAALAEPEALAEDIRAFFRPLR